MPINKRNIVHANEAVCMLYAGFLPLPLFGFTDGPMQRSQQERPWSEQEIMSDVAYDQE